MIDAIVIGSLNTDLIVSGATRLLGPGEDTLAESLTISAGGKSRNIAAMLATLRESGEGIAFVGKTVKDRFGFWEYPVISFKELGINTDNVQILSRLEENDMPGLAIIPVDKKGENQIYVVPGIRQDFSSKDIEKSEKLFKAVGKGKGFAIVVLEMPAQTAISAIKMSQKYGLKLFVDPGGIQSVPELKEAVKLGGFLLKPNEHEAKIISGVDVRNFASAEVAAKKMLGFGYEYIVITHGKNGAYLFGKDEKLHVEIPKIDVSGGASVGAGDQTLAGIIFGLQKGLDIKDAVCLGVVAGTLQASKKGIVPVEASEVEKYL